VSQVLPYVTQQFVSRARRHICVTLLITHIYVNKLITNYQLLLITHIINYCYQLLIIHICILYVYKWICAIYYVKLLQERQGFSNLTVVLNAFIRYSR